jgi:hypothetical protein
VTLIEAHPKKEETSDPTMISGSTGVMMALRSMASTGLRSLLILKMAECPNVLPQVERKQ